MINVQRHHRDGKYWPAGSTLWISVETSNKCHLVWVKHIYLELIRVENRVKTNLQSSMHSIGASAREKCVDNWLFTLFQSNYSNFPIYLLSKSARGTINRSKTKWMKSQFGVVSCCRLHTHDFLAKFPSIAVPSVQCSSRTFHHRTSFFFLFSLLPNTSCLACELRAHRTSMRISFSFLLARVRECGCLCRLKYSQFAGCLMHEHAAHTHTRAEKVNAATPFRSVWMSWCSKKKKKIKTKREAYQTGNKWLHIQ